MAETKWMGGKLCQANTKQKKAGLAKRMSKQISENDF